MFEVSEHCRNFALVNQNQHPNVVINLIQKAVTGYMIIFHFVNSIFQMDANRKGEHVII